MADKNGSITMIDVRRAVKNLDPKRKDDLLAQLIEAVFDDFFDDDLDRVEDMLETIENITGLENLMSIYH